MKLDKTQLNGKTSEIPRLRDLTFLKYTYKAIYKFSIVIIKIAVTFFPTILQNPKATYNYKNIQIAKASLHKKRRDGGITFLNFKIYCKHTEIKTRNYFH